MMNKQKGWPQCEKCDQWKENKCRAVNEEGLSLCEVMSRKVFNYLVKQEDKIMIKPGDKVRMNDNYYVSEENKNKIWVVRSEPWECCGTQVVSLQGKSGGYAVDGLDLIEED